MNDHFYFFRIEAERFQSGKNIRNRCNMIGAENIDHFIVSS